MTAPGHHLALLPLHGDLTEDRALAVAQEAGRNGALELVDAVVVRSDGHGGVDLEPAPGATVFDPEAWRWLLGEALQCTEARDRHHRSLRGDGSGISSSFAAELRAVLRCPGTYLAGIVSRLDAESVVAALRRFPSTTLVYGRLPDWALTTMTRWRELVGGSPALRLA